MPNNETINILVSIEDRCAICLKIEDTVNRPNNPDIRDIVRAYVSYHFGNVSFEWREMKTLFSEDYFECIGEDWNIENFM